MTFPPSPSPRKSITTFVLRSANSLVNPFLRPRRHRNKCREPKYGEQDINSGVSVCVGEASRAVELWNTGLVDEEGDAKPALSHLYT